jgi:CubicO group peptidase (beta-lactamase class C family)
MTWPLAQGHEVAGGRPVVIRPAADNASNWPAGSVVSSASDLSRFVVAFLNEGRLDGKPALSASLVKTLSTPYVNQPGRLKPMYGYGLTIVTRRGVRFVEHGGSRAGYGSFISMAPDHRVGIVVVATRTGSSLPRLVEKATELLLPLEPEPPRKARPAISMTREEMTRYAGWYSQVGDDTGTSVVARDSGLALRTGSAETPIVKVGENEFEIHRANGSVEDVWFVLGTDGRAEFLYRGTRAHARLK